MKKAALFLCMLASPAVAQMQVLPPVGQKLGETLSQRSPARTYAGTCAYCHGTNVGPIILGRHLPAAYIKGMVRAGRNGMPAFRPTEISAAELETLSTWVAASAANPVEHGQ
jgi:mono/diheme cytochrome c family protein